MRTLIIPCAGKSSRFPNMKPKWMLTHPDGHLMIEKALPLQAFSDFDRIVITIVKPHIQKYEADLVLTQIFGNRVELCVLDDFTSSASETIALTVKKMKITGSVIIKDSDNFVDFELPEDLCNAIVGLDVNNNSIVNNLPNKSFLILDEQQSTISDIVEKRIVSNIICLGVYIFSDIQDFMEAYECLKHKDDGELYISNCISKILADTGIIFGYIQAKHYKDWGTLQEWRIVQLCHTTYFVDVDGVLLVNRGQYGSLNWNNSTEIIEANCKKIAALQTKGAQIVITTARPEKYREKLEAILHENGIFPAAIVMGLNHGPRVLINDYSPTNPYPSASAINILRNTSLEDVL